MNPPTGERKILLLYDHMLGVGGVESHILGLISHSLPKYRYTIISPVTQDFYKKALAARAEVIPWPEIHPLNPINLIEMIRMFIKKRPDLIHIHSPNAAIAGRIAAYICRIPCAVTIHLPVTLYHGSRQTLRARAGRQLFIWIDSFLNHFLTNRIIFVSEAIYRSSLAAGIVSPKNCQVIPNGIDLENFHPHMTNQAIRQEAGTNLNTLVLCFAGRLDVQKGADILLEALSRLRKSEIDYQVWIIGDGPERESLENIARQKGIIDRVHFFGFKENIPALLNASDIFILPSRYEALSIVLLEALASGLPSIVTNVGDNPSVVENNVNGFVVKPEQPEELANAISILIDNPVLREEMGNQALVRAQQFSLEKMVNAIEKIYSQILTRV